MDRSFKGLLIISVFLIISISVHSQERAIFKGKIIASDTKETLIGAHVLLQSDRSTGTVTDENGSFIIEVDPGRHTFIFSFTGMLSDSITLNLASGQVIERQISMQFEVSRFDEFEVRAGRFDRALEDITVSMEVIKADIIASKNTTNVMTILNYVPGLVILDSEPQIRGGSGFTFGVGSKVGVFVDDLPMLSADASRPYWDFIPVESIEQIEVVKGAASVLSGANSLSGAIYINTKRPKLEPETHIKVYSGFYSTPKDPDMKWWDGFPYITGADFLHSRTYGSSDFVYGGNLHFEHGYLGAPRPNPNIIDTLTNFQDSEMAVRRGRINVNYRKRSKTVEGLNYGINGIFMLSHNNMTLAWLNDTTGFYRGYPGAVLLQDQFIFNLDPYINYYSEGGFKHSLKTRFLRSDVKGSNNQNNEAIIYYADYNFKREYTFLKDFAFIGGLSTQYNDVRSQMYTGGGSTDNNLLNISGYAEVESNLSEIVKFSFGARFEYFSLNGASADFKPVFRAGTAIRMMQETYFRMSYGQGYRYPTIAERYILNNLGSFAVFPNPSLKPEQSTNLEVGVKQRFRFMKFMGYLDASVFQQDYENTVEYLFGFWDSTFTYALAGFRFLNTGKSRVTGIDISLTAIGKAGNHGEVRTLFGYNYIMPKTLEPDLVFATDFRPGGNPDFSYNNTSVNPEDQILKYRFLHNISADIEYIYKNWSAGMSMKYYSKIENLDKAILDFEDATLAAGGTLQPILYRDYFENHNNGNMIFDFRLAYQMNIHRFSLISDNIFNRWYSLRPLKAEPMRKVMLQYALNF